MAQVLLELDNVSKYYINGQNVVAGLNKVSLKFSRGEFVAVTGESGSGKSTLAHILGGILPYEDGEVYVQEEPTSHYDSADWERYRRDRVAFISQNYGILPGASVLGNVVSALRLSGMDKRLARDEARSILEEVELWPMRHRRAARLSSGQKQRLAIARALAKPCPILIADEPTGNLDPENSAKVIDLLARAAQERLVILITHEFSEAEAHVTRHIRMREAEVDGDAQLRENPIAQPPEITRRATKPLGGYVARLQLRSRPVWCATVLMFCALTAFAVFSFLGSFIVALDDTNTRIYSSEAFLNGNMERIVVVRKDGADLTQEDLEAILALEQVTEIERFGYVADYSYSYQADTDYLTHYSVYNYGSPDSPMYMELPATEPLLTDQFVRTVPVGVDSFLTAGRLPENFYEAVAGDEALLGQTVTVYLSHFQKWASGSYIKLEVTVVGVTDRDSGLYFHDDVARMLTTDYWMGWSFIPTDCQVLDDLYYQDYRNVGTGVIFHTEQLPANGSEPVYRDLADGEVLISQPLYRYLRDIMGYITLGDGSTPASVYDYLYENGVYYFRGLWPGELHWSIAGLHDSTLHYSFQLTQSAFDELVQVRHEDYVDQISLTVTDYAYTDRVIAALEEAGYYALSPYVLGSARVDSELADQRMQTLGVCIGALLAVLLLQWIVLRALFGMEFEAYRILSNIGLTWTGAKRSVRWQILVFTVLGQLLALGGIALCVELGVKRIVDLTKYLQTPYWLMLSAVHLVSLIAASGGIIRGLKKQVYPLSARYSDLDLESGEQEVAK